MLISPLYISYLNTRHVYGTLIRNIWFMRLRKYKDELQDGHFLTTIVTVVWQTEMLNLLGWPTLESRRYISRLTYLYKIMHHHTPAIHLLPYYLPTQYPTKHLHQHHFTLPAIAIHYCLSAKLFSENYQTMEQLTG